VTPTASVSAGQRDVGQSSALGSRLRQPEQLISSTLLTLIVILAKATFCSANQLEKTSA
jgi:hypothetical protein